MERETMTADNDNSNAALLPAGMSDTLPPDAAHEAQVVEGLMNTFAAFGYERVKPPLVEFEETLFRGPGAVTANDAFRLMDPASQRMVAIRADMTPQIARIAMNRLVNAPRPMRLSYAGQVLRVRGSQLRGARQFGQVGVELIGTESRAADAEIVLMAAEALTRLGIEGLSVDLCISTLIPAICRDFSIDPDLERRLVQILDRKDAAAIETLRSDLGDTATDLFVALLSATGEAATMLDRLAALDLGSEAAAQRMDIQLVCNAIMDAAPDLKLTIDPVERRGWEYHTGVSFTFFASSARGELGAGGRYVTGDDNDGASREHATGLTLFTDTLLQAIGEASTVSKVFLPQDCPDGDAAALRAEGWVTVRGLEDVSDAKAEARRLGCTHVFSDRKPIAVD